MTAKFYCNVCNNPCDPSPTRRWEHVRADLGLEVVVLRGNKPVGDTHLCDECILNMFWVMLERAPDSKLRLRQRAMYAREASVIMKEEELKPREDSLLALSNKLQKEKEEIKALTSLYENHAQVKEEMDNLKVQIEAVKAREKDAIKRAFNEGKQAAVDEKCYSDYMNKVSYNQYRRSGN